MKHLTNLQKNISKYNNKSAKWVHLLIQFTVNSINLISEVDIFQMDDIIMVLLPLKLMVGDIRNFSLTKTMEGIHKSHTKTFLNVAINYHNRYTEYQYN